MTPPLTTVRMPGNTLISRRGKIWMLLEWGNPKIRTTFTILKTYCADIFSRKSWIASKNRLILPQGLNSRGVLTWSWTDLTFAKLMRSSKRSSSLRISHLMIRSRKSGKHSLTFTPSTSTMTYWLYTWCWGMKSSTRSKTYVSLPINLRPQRKREADRPQCSNQTRSHRWLYKLVPPRKAWYKLKNAYLTRCCKRKDRFQGPERD